MAVGLRLAAMWGTVENLAPTSRDLAAGRCINILSGEVCPGVVFITFGGPQGHDDRMASRMASCGALATRLPVKLIQAPPARLSIQNDSQAMIAAIGIVSTHAPTMLVAIPQRTALRRLILPTPAMAPAMACVVKTGRPKWVASRTAPAAPVSAQNPLRGLRRVSRALASSRCRAGAVIQSWEPLA